MRNIDFFANEEGLDTIENNATVDVDREGVDGDSDSEDTGSLRCARQLVFFSHLGDQPILRFFIISANGNVKAKAVHL
jgi:hypothetical protein